MKKIIMIEKEIRNIREKYPKNINDEFELKYVNESIEKYQEENYEDYLIKKFNIPEELIGGRPESSQDAKIY